MLGLALFADGYRPKQDKSWVLVAPPGAGGNAATLVLARAATTELTPPPPELRHRRVRRSADNRHPGRSAARDAAPDPARLEHDDFSPYAAMMADPDTARFITRRGQPLDAPQVWSEMAFLVGHWQLLGHGMFVVEERATGAFVGRIGPLAPEGWPGFEIAWGLTRSARGKGYAAEAARAAIDWSFRTFDLDRIISIIHPQNIASQRVAERVGERRTAEQFTPFREACDIWELRREDWSATSG